MKGASWPQPLGNEHNNISLCVLLWGALSVFLQQQGFPCLNPCSPGCSHTGFSLQMKDGKTKLLALAMFMMSPTGTKW